MNTLSGVAEPYSTLTLDGLNATSTLIDDAVGDYLPISGGTLQSSTGITRLGIAASTLGTLEYFTTAGVSQASMFYNIGTSELRFNVGTATNILRMGSSTITFARNISMGNTNRITNLGAGTGANDAISYTQAMLRNGANAATADIPMGNFKLTGLANGVAATDAATVSQIAAYLPLAGGLMTGTITSNSSTPFNFDNANAPVTCRMSAGNVSVTNACTLQMNSNSASVLDFRDNTNVTKAQFKYLYGTPGSLNMLVNAVTALSTTDTLATFGVPVAMSSQKITGLLAGAAASTDAANVTQMEAADLVVTNAFTTADNLRLKLDGTTAMTGSLNINGYSVNNVANVRSPTGVDLVLGRTGAGTELQITSTAILVGKDLQLSGANINANSNSVNNVVNVRSPTATDLVLGRTGTGTEIQIKATEILIGKDITMSGNINMGTYYIGLQAGVNPTDAVNKGQLDTKTYLKTSSTSNGSLTIADPSSSTTTVTFRNEYTLLGSPYGVCQFITEALAQVWIKANVTTHAKESGIQLDAGTFIFFTGDVASPTVRFNYDASSTNEMNVYGRLNMRTNKITGVTAGATGTTEAVNVTQMEAADNLRVKLDGTSAMGGNFDVNNHKVVNMLPSTANTDGVRHDQVINKFVPLTGGSAVNQAMTGQLYMGNNRIGSLSPGLTSLDAVNYQQIAESSIPLTAWRSGETIQTVRKSPAFSQNLTNTSCTVATAQVPLISTSMSVTAGNHIVVTATFECSSTGGGGDDHFRIVYEYGTTPTTVTWNYNLGAPTGFRNRVCTQEYCFLAPNTNTRTILARLYNDGDDTMTINDTNWSFVVRQIKA